MRGKEKKTTNDWFDALHGRVTIIYIPVWKWIIVNQLSHQSLSMRMNWKLYIFFSAAAALDQNEEKLSSRFALNTEYRLLAYTPNRECQRYLIASSRGNDVRVSFSLIWWHVIVGFGVRVHSYTAIVLAFGNGMHPAMKLSNQWQLAWHLFH